MKKEISLDQCNEGSTAPETPLSLVGERFDQISLSESSAGRSSTGPFMGSSNAIRRGQHVKFDRLKQRTLPVPRESVSTNATQPSSRSLPFFMHDDDFLLSEQGFRRYDGYLRITEDYHAERRSDNSIIRTGQSNTFVDEIRQWLRPNRISPNDADQWKAVPISKILMTKTEDAFFRARTDRGPSLEPIRDCGIITINKSGTGQQGEQHDAMDHFRLQQPPNEPSTDKLKRLVQMNELTFDTIRNMEIEESIGLPTWDWRLDREVKARRDPDVNDSETKDNRGRALKSAVERHNVRNMRKESLTYERMETRLRNVPIVSPQTCKMLFRDKEYLAWLNK